jgi:hypothetical protein
MRTRAIPTALILFCAVCGLIALSPAAAQENYQIVIPDPLPHGYEYTLVTAGPAADSEDYQDVWAEAFPSATGYSLYLRSDIPNEEGLEGIIVFTFPSAAEAAADYAYVAENEYPPLSVVIGQYREEFQAYYNITDAEMAKLDELNSTIPDALGPGEGIVVITGNKVILLQGVEGETFIDVVIAIYQANGGAIPATAPAATQSPGFVSLLAVPALAAGCLLWRGRHGR